MTVIATARDVIVNDRFGRMGPMWRCDGCKKSEVDVEVPDDELDTDPFIKLPS